MLEFFKSKKELERINRKLGEAVSLLEDIEKGTCEYGINEKDMPMLITVYNTFKWRDMVDFDIDSALSFDKETNEIVVDEDMLLRVIMIVNPYQQARRIRLKKREKKQKNNK